VRRRQHRPARGERRGGQHARRASAAHQDDHGDHRRGNEPARGDQQPAHAPAPRAEAAGDHPVAIGLDSLTQRERRARLRHGRRNQRTATLGELLVDGFEGRVGVSGLHGLVYKTLSRLGSIPRAT
jgi:hypothetical protein